MKILAVCGLGQGTSLILRMSIETVLSEKGVVADVDHMDVSLAAGTDADYIFTSNELAQNLRNHRAKVIVVNNYFDKKEVETALQEVFEKL